MAHPRSTLDEYTLAAFIAGSLSPRRRRKVVAQLAVDAEARTLLNMAMDALRAAAPALDVPHPSIQAA